MLDAVGRWEAFDEDRLSVPSSRAGSKEPSAERMHSRRTPPSPNSSIPESDALIYTEFSGKGRQSPLMEQGFSPSPSLFSHEGSVDVDLHSAVDHAQPTYAKEDSGQDLLPRVIEILV